MSAITLHKTNVHLLAFSLLLSLFSCFHGASSKLGRHPHGQELRTVPSQQPARNQSPQSNSPQDQNAANNLRNLEVDPPPVQSSDKTPALALTVACEPPR